MPNNYFKNHEVAYEAGKKFKYLQDVMQKVQDELGKRPGMVYDHRNLFAIALITTDFTGVPEEKQGEHLERAYRELHSVFDTPGPNDPKKADFEKVKPYIKKIYDNVVTDMSTVDFNDRDQILKVFFAIYISQPLGTLIRDYAQSAMELYPTHEDKARIDAISSKVTAVKDEADYSMAKEGLFEMRQYGEKLFAPESSNDPLLKLKSEISHAVSDSTLRGSDKVIIDPTAGEFSAKFFMKEPIEVNIDRGNGIEPFDNDDYSQYYVTHLATGNMNTSFEFQMLAEVQGKIPTDSVLMINGKNIHEIEADYKNLSWAKRGAAVGNVLREALLNGEPVTLVTSTFTNDGKLAFHNKDIRLDLDKMNELDRKNYSFIRRALDKLRIYSIPKKYPTNKERDAKLKAVLENPDSSHQKRVKDYEEEFINAYNNLAPGRKRDSGCPRLIDKLTREDVKKTDTAHETETVKTNDNARENIKIEDFTKEELKSNVSKNPPIEPPVQKDMQSLNK